MATLSTVLDIPSAYQLQLVKYANVACLAILVADYATTFEQEVNLVWKSRWGTVKVLYTLSRYAIFAAVAIFLAAILDSDTPQRLCKTLNWVVTGLLLCGVSTSEAILVLRTLAVWNNDRTLRAWLISFYLVIAAAFIPVSILFTISYGDAVDIPGCRPVLMREDYMYAILFLMMLFNTVLLILMTYRVVKHYHGSRNPLLRTLYNDGILFYSCIAIVSAANIIALVVLPSTLKNILQNFHYIMHSVLSCRIILNIRAVDAARIGTLGHDVSRSIQFARGDIPDLSVLTDTGEADDEIDATSIIDFAA